MCSFDEIVLTRQESFILFLASFKKTLKIKYDIVSKSALPRHGLVRLNVSYNERNEDALPLRDGTYSLTDVGKRYKIYCRRERRHRYLTPIVVAFLTTLATCLLEKLWLPVLLSWLQGLF